MPDGSGFAGAGAPAETGGQGALSGLTITPGGGSAGQMGGSSGSPALLLSDVGTKRSFVSVQRASYNFALPKTQYGLRIVADAINNTSNASGTYRQSSLFGSGGGFVGADLRNGHSLDVSYKLGVYNLYAQFGYCPSGNYTRNVVMGPMIGVSNYSDSFEVTDNTVSWLSSDGKHSTNMITFGGWGELDASGLFGAVSGKNIGKGSKLYLAAMGGIGKEWQSFNWEALLTFWSSSKGSLFSSSKYGKYIPALSTQIGYVGYYLKQNSQDETSSRFLVTGALPNALNENAKVDFGIYVVRVSGSF